MLKKYTIVLLSLHFIMHISAWHAAPQEEPSVLKTSNVTVFSKDQQLGVLKKIAANINDMQELREYIITVPPFIILDNRNILDFLATIPSPYQPKQRRFARKVKAISLFDYVHDAWQEVIRSTKKGKMSNVTRSKLNDIRNTLELAFKHKLTANNEALTHFISAAHMHGSTLIMRPLTPLIQAPAHTQVTQPADAHNALQRAIASYYNDEVIEYMLKKGPLPTELPLSIIIQSFVTSDQRDPSVAGVSCSYNPMDHNEHITTIHTVYGHHAGLKDLSIAKDTYYVLNDMVYPVINIKKTRLEQQVDMPEAMLINNEPALAQRSSLDSVAARDIAKITQALEQKYKQSVCLYFIKQEHTLYLISFELVSQQQQTICNFIDPAYTKKARKDDAVTIYPLQPTEHIVVIKDPQSILMAHNAQELLEKYDPKDPEITIGIIEQQPAQWSTHKKMLDQLPIPLFYSPSYTHIQHWINKKLTPLVIDCQAQLMFPYRRRKDFCTLYHTIINGLMQPSYIENLSVLDTFFTPLPEAQKSSLRPQEFFGGVAMTHLFDLLRAQDPQTALHALRSILYRLQLKIKRAEVAAKEQSETQSIFSELQKLQKQYDYIELVAYQLYKKIYTHIKAKTEQSFLDRDYLFLINVLKTLITQKDNPMVVDAVSFDMLS